MSVADPSSQGVTGASMPSLRGTKVVILSRCAWTLFNFRLSLMHEIKSRGGRVVALGGGGDGFESRLATAGIQFRAIPVSRRGLNPVSDCWLLLKLIREFVRERPEVVHCFTIKPAIYGTLAARLCGVRARVVTITGLGHAFTSASGWLTRIVSALYKFALAHAHIVFFQNEDDRRLFVERKLVSPQKALLCAGSGVDLSRFAPVPVPVASGSAAPRFLMIARLIREKGVIEFLRAAKLVRERHPEAEFRLLGGEDPRNPSALSAEDVEALKHSADVTWLGETVDVRPFIAEADVIVLPSYREGLPRSLLEGGAMGRAAIATDVVGCRDVVVHGVTGYLVPSQDVNALAGAMEELIRHPERVVQFGEAAQRRVGDRFDERTVLRDTIRQYAKLTDERD